MRKRKNTTPPSNPFELEQIVAVLIATILLLVEGWLLSRQEKRREKRREERRRKPIIFQLLKQIKKIKGVF